LHGLVLLITKDFLARDKKSFDEYQTWSGKLSARTPRLDGLTLLSGCGGPRRDLQIPKIEFGFGRFLHPNTILITKILLALAWLWHGFV
jgi:hypothetical protein